MEKQACDQVLINNDFYNDLKDDWYTASNHPIALLRAENALRGPWIIQSIQERFKQDSVHILDIGCGAGFLSNQLARSNYDVIGVDISQESLEVAARFDETKKAVYLYANAYHLPFIKESFDLVCAMDILEHVDNPTQLITEASRVLKPGGLFFFHTFNRNFLSYLTIIKGVDWFVNNAPPQMHVYPLFIKPHELTEMCSVQSLQVQTLKGFIPDIARTAFWKMLITGQVAKEFRFRFCKNLSTGYCGYATKSF